MDNMIVGVIMDAMKTNGRICLSEAIEVWNNYGKVFYHRDILNPNWESAIGGSRGLPLHLKLSKFEGQKIHRKLARLYGESKLRSLDLDCIKYQLLDQGLSYGTDCVKNNYDHYKGIVRW